MGEDMVLVRGYGSCWCGLLVDDCFFLFGYVCFFWYICGIGGLRKEMWSWFVKILVVCVISLVVGKLLFFV